MKFPKSKEFVLGKYAKTYNPNGTRIYKVVSTMYGRPQYIEVVYIGLYRHDGFTLGKQARPFWVNNEAHSNKYIPCTLKA